MGFRHNLMVYSDNRGVSVGGKRLRSELLITFPFAARIDLRLMNRTRVVILLGITSFFSLIALFLLTVVIHEGAHYVAAVIMKVPVASFIWFDPHYLAPVFVSASTEYTLGVKIVSYAGGLVTGVLLLSILIFKRGWFKQSLYRWLLGFYMATLGFWQVCQGILEGAFHEMYIADATNVFSLSYCIGYASAVLGMVSYWVLVPGLKSLLDNEKYGWSKT